MWASSPVSGCTSAAPTSSCWAGWFQLVRCGAFTCFSSTSKSGILPKMSTVLKSGRGGREEKNKTVKYKSRKKKIRAEGSRSDGQVDFLLDCFLAERKSIFRVYCSTSSEAEVWKSWSAWIRHLQEEEMCLYSSICWAKAVQTPNLPLLLGWECGDCTRHGRELEQKTPPRHTHHASWFTWQMLCITLCLHSDLDIHISLSPSRPHVHQKKKKRMMSEGKKIVVSRLPRPRPCVWLALCLLMSQPDWLNQWCQWGWSLFACRFSANGFFCFSSFPSPFQQCWEQASCTNSYEFHEQWLCRTIESFRLEKTFKTIRSSCCCRAFAQ